MNTSEQPGPHTSEIPRGDYDPRVVLAAERTLLAWIRTGLALMGFGFVVARFGLFLREIASAQGVGPVKHAGLSQWGGIGLVVLAVIVTASAAVRNARFVQRYNEGIVLRPGPISTGAVLAVILAFLGVVMALYLLLLR
jgi:putative membrane protein